MQMQKTMMYLSPYIKDKIKKIAKSEGTSQAEVIRTALEAGLGTGSSQKALSAESLLKLVQLGKKYQTGKLPRTSALTEIDKMWQEWDNKK
ncbi:MAG: hypothetical protein ACD_38C00030G0005 [uncultured bacterium]|uniref:Ribbon-helix-helix protein CopG domain-containing protein n=1 Tax=Candidatus Daviesbacteria bacterium GW2011_GWC2_40_12 TaxID=1618431 RepID=A0A0G0QNT5_9BACT|nr:MAG: hypothetical protein ACD_38C00030G0005 [uncultured bacterium]KKQ84849.1 MAG: hypothetical protein UT04_C0011G0023 [Candidatus Daviesbacteria bacterium GW2011_GWF2_38_7]KKR16518.1 MAG: hypothetical protein UT45_C0005G0047 [Candidatus Daviesbacteria bacterium GW2011_GWA2_39_33]KKR24512.1 MAG: hypothetical protein UT54_C0018G0012 [Candidatus Daviesbacteria bacterium GW2011_GWB1_39_5]KKR41783.1 MAG: hypothetical protein UT77_C0006G0015 [Candidatus Daviesbacteria bacterium GW2011_GWC2_40_12]